MEAAASAVTDRKYGTVYEFELEGEIPLPDRVVRESTLYAALDELPINMAMRVNRAQAAMRALISRYRKRRGSQHRFVTKKLSERWSRVWRTGPVDPGSAKQ